MSSIGAIKRAVNAQLAHFNLAIAREASVPKLERLFFSLRHSNLVPKTVFDVGVAYGTDWLYSAFPHAKFHLIDPTRESLPHMKAWAKKLNAEVHNVALGAEAETLDITHPTQIINSTLMQLAPHVTNSIEQRYQVPVRRFDSLFTAIERPALCKIDVEGAELMVLVGMGEQIQSLDAIIVETSINSLYQNGPEFDDVVLYMSKKRFSFFDIGALVRRPFDGALHQIDAIFVPDDSPLRVRRWD
jgi:FkbM family methyltransferase